MRKNCSLITRSCSYFKNFFISLKPKKICHEGYCIGLGDCLTPTNRNRPIFVGRFSKRLGYKLFPGDLEHGRENFWGRQKVFLLNFPNHSLPRIHFALLGFLNEISGKLAQEWYFPLLTLPGFVNKKKPQDKPQ